MRVPFLDLTRQHGRIRAEIERAISRVISRGLFVLGPELEAFESEFAAFLGARYAVGVASGTDALAISLLASEAVGPGDEVITSAFSAAFTALAIVRAGARPVFVDVDPETLNIDPNRIESSITERTKAIVPVHLYGRPAPMDSIIAIAERYDLKVIEDACQAHGATFNGAKVGTLSLAAAFSFYPTKNLGALGDAGAVVTNERSVYERARMLRHGGQASPYDHRLLGFSSRLDELQAAVLRVKLKYLQEWNERRRQLAEIYNHKLRGLGITLLCNDSGHVYHLYVVRSREREQIRKRLYAEGIQTLVHYPKALHKQGAFAQFAPRRPLYNAELAAEEVFSLPLYPELTDEEAEYVCDRLKSIIG